MKKKILLTAIAISVISSYSSVLARDISGFKTLDNTIVLEGVAKQSLANAINKGLDSNQPINTLSSVVAVQNDVNSSNITVDSDLTFDDLPDSVLSSEGAVYIGDIDGFSEFTNTSSFSVNFTDQEFKDYVAENVSNVKGPIFNYAVSYDEATGNVNFVGGGSNYRGYNPAVIAAPVAAQLGGYLTQLNSYDEAFSHMDKYMMLTKKQRMSIKNRNKYAAASTETDSVIGYLHSNYSNPHVWANPYSTFENVPLKNGPRVSNVSYGTFIGVDSEMYSFGQGWDGMVSLYAGYNGSHQAYLGNSIYQNGGTLGIAGMLYKDNFFTGLTLNTGANVAEANTMFGSEDFTLFMAGVASKTGYNFEFKDGKFILQPNLLLSYTMVNTFDYYNGAGVKINADALHAIQVEPGVQLIANLKNNWQPYMGVSFVYNIMDKAAFSANDVALPELSVKPYAKYGIGIRKLWGERFSGFLQTFFTGGGRNGIGIQLGFRWEIGK